MRRRAGTDRERARENGTDRKSKRRRGIKIERGRERQTDIERGRDRERGRRHTVIRQQLRSDCCKAERSLSGLL